MAQREEITELLRECENLRESTSSKATRMKLLSKILTIVIIVTGVAIGVMAAATSSELVRYWGPVILGPAVTAIKIFATSFKIDRQGVAYMQISTKMSEFIRKIRRIQRKRLSEEEIDDALDKLGKELDSLKLSMFCTDSFKRIQSARANSQTSVSLSDETPAALATTETPTLHTVTTE